MNRIIFYTLCFTIAGMITGCKNNHQETLFTKVENSNIDFENKITETTDLNVFKYRNFYNGGGVAVGDINNDGLPDAFFTANQGPNRLYLNKGNFRFEDITEKAGFSVTKKQWSTGVVFADVNGDGWLDIYVCNAGNMLEKEWRKNQLFINNHDLTFTERAAEYGLDNDGYTTQVSFFDYDLDGDLDCFMVNNSPIPVNTLNYANMRDKPESEWGVKDLLKGGGDHLFKNENGKFTEVTRTAGIHGGLISLGLGVNVADVNGDGYPDVYVSNDFFERDYLYINQKDGTFKDELEARIAHTSLSSMGADIQDINNDGHPDIFTTDMLPSDDYRLKANTTFDNYDVFQLKRKQDFYNQYTQNTLQVNNGNGHFWETAYYSGVASSDWSWGGLIFDADNDGLSDIYVCNGIYRDVTDQDFIDFFGDEVIQQMTLTGKKEDVSNIIKEMPSNPIPNSAFKNMGNLKFKDFSTDWGLGTPSFSNGAAYADLDNDGDLDLIVNNVNQKAFIYRNNASHQGGNHYIAVNLRYKKPNGFAVGSVIKVYTNNQVLVREVIPSRGFQSSVEYRQTFGLGKGDVDSMVITWPDLKTTTLIRPVLNKQHEIVYDSVTASIAPPAADTRTTYFSSEAQQFEKHQEDPYVDYYFERNIPFLLSRQGPKLAVGDVNGDGLADLFIGGAKDQPGKLYLQTAKWFIKKEIPDLRTFSFNDVTAALFFDCDGDGDLDLFWGGGGNFASTGFQNQLFINDGKGNFTLKRGALPVSNTNCGAATALDYDGDGDLDLFIGSRSSPQNYGVTPASFLLQNDGKGNFKDVTAAAAPALAAPGMITAGAFADLDGDGRKELIITGEWMAPQIYQWNGKQFIKRPAAGLDGLYGWWQAMKVADVDNDGHPDLVLGNLGENFYLQPHPNAPVRLWINDFDNNGVSEKIISYTVNGKEVPVFSKREITDQIPSLKKQNLKHHDYAGKTMQDIFSEGLKAATIKEVTTGSSVIAYNDGKGHFTIRPLPLRAQLSSINALEVADINHDGLPDIITGGNLLTMLPQFGALDANTGVVLLNNKKRQFLAAEDKSSGLALKGECRDIAVFDFKKQRCALFLINNDFPLLYKIGEKK